MKTSENNKCSTLGRAIKNPKYFCGYLGNGVTVYGAGTIYGNHHLLVEIHLPQGPPLGGMVFHGANPCLNHTFNTDQQGSSHP